MAISGVNDICLNQQVFAQEVGRMCRVGQDSPNPCRSEKDIPGVFCREKAIRRGLIEQINVLSGFRDDGLVSFRIADPTSSRCPATYTRLA